MSAEESDGRPCELHSSSYPLYYSDCHHAVVSVVFFSQKRGSSDATVEVTLTATVVTVEAPQCKRKRTALMEEAKTESDRNRGKTRVNKRAFTRW